MSVFSKSPGFLLTYIHRIFDICLGIGLLIGLYSFFWPDSIDSKSPQIALLIIVATIFSLFGLKVAGVYRNWARSETVTECNRIVFGVLIAFTCMLVTGYLFKVSQVYSRRVILLWVMVWPAVMCLERILVKKIVLPAVIDSEAFRRVVIAGTGKTGINIANWISENPWSGMKFAGFFESGSASDETVDSCLGHVDDLGDYVRENNIDVVFVTMPMREEEKIQLILADMEDSAAQVYYFPDMSIFAHLLGGDVANVAGRTAIIMRSSPFEGVSGIVKRLEDVILSSLILIMVSPVMLFVAAGIKLTSKGPVLFQQWRYGLGGEPFKIYKFRTMKVMEDGYNFVPVTRDDPRVTKFGAFLRRNSLDELPQFINVLQGRMSIVGPRPHAVKMNEEYRKRIPGYMLRHISKPGITGLAQVSGYKGEVQTEEDMENRIEFDISYLRNWSLILDFEIIFKTVFRRAWRQK
ncbi:undecaprenyl-phosphate glucose phosphotransferase [Maridesulfovibrio bastinii]|uniref:undecaprenyl-phosphate glucose phosphotransferase n=1 Tax=Maridesulfovibrio bastinii TaxID=47157 RepID=UPI0004041F5C|nr:undecaprenyl-phosphate glucose phosphotransferase [Maridesulfovibrio bastinii]